MHTWDQRRILKSCNKAGGTQWGCNRLEFHIYAISFSKLTLPTNTCIFEGMCTWGAGVWHLSLLFMQSFQHYSSGGFSCKPLALILPPTESQHLPQNLNQIKKNFPIIFGKSFLETVLNITYYLRFWNERPHCTKKTLSYVKNCSQFTHEWEFPFADKWSKFNINLTHALTHESEQQEK